MNSFAKEGLSTNGPCCIQSGNVYFEGLSHNMAKIINRFSLGGIVSNAVFSPAGIVGPRLSRWVGKLSRYTGLKMPQRVPLEGALDGDLYPRKNAGNRWTSSPLVSPRKPISMSAFMSSSPPCKKVNLLYINHLIK
jgi:hypothetical protein